MRNTRHAAIMTLVVCGSCSVVASQGCGANPSPVPGNTATHPVASTQATPSSSQVDGREAAAPVASATASLPTAPVAKPSACPDGMVDIQRACIDRYEAPNEPGAAPMVMRTSDEAVAWCTEHGKRLCTEDEWLRACQGPEGHRYPYGATYQEHACNQDATYRIPRWGLLAKWPAEAAVAEASRLNQAEASGTRATCGSAEGVFDLTGNVAEWVVKLHPHPEACKKDNEKKNEHVVQGCSWVKCYRPPHEPACDYVNCAHGPGFRSYEIGFRCCKDRGEGG